MSNFYKVSKKELDVYSDLFNENDIILPKRQTPYSCGYDFYLPYDVEINALETIKIFSGVKVKLASDEFLMISLRSSAAIKNGLILANQVGIIDSDYFENPGNDGHIIIVLKHILNKKTILKKGERIAQGIIMKYYTTADDEVINKPRSGGLGSTN